MVFNEVFKRYVTKSGLVFTVNKKTGKLVQCKISKNSAGYPQVSTYKNNMPGCITVHKLVWNTFNGEILKGFEIDHIDDNKENASLSNLQLLTKSENVKKSYQSSHRHRPDHKGKNNPMYGKQLSEETRRKMSEAAKRRYSKKDA